MKPNLSVVKSLCVLRLSAIGDVCHAVAMVQAIQRQHPRIKITWIIGKVEYQLLKHLPDIEFIVFDKSQGWKSYLNLNKALKGRKFEILLHMQVALRATIASMVVSARYRLGFDRARAKEGQWLVTNHQVAPLKNPHVLEGFMGFAKAIGIDDLTPKWNIPVLNADSEFAQQLIGENKKTFIICAAASKAERNWLADRYAVIADHAVQQGFQVILCGGPTNIEKNLAKTIQFYSQHPLNNQVGKTTLTQLLALLKRASIVLAPDSGPAHMAVTQNTPVIGLYAHSNPNRTGPYLSLNHVVSQYQQAVSAQVQGEIPWGKRAKGSQLMAMIEVDTVLEKFNHLSQSLNR